MAFRTEPVTTYRELVICDDCGKETVMREKAKQPLGFDNRMNGALTYGYTFKQERGVFKNYCRDCKKKYQ